MLSSTFENVLICIPYLCSKNTYTCLNKDFDNVWASINPKTLDTAIATVLISENDGVKCINFQFTSSEFSKQFGLPICSLCDLELLSARVEGFPLWFRTKSLMSMLLIFTGNQERQRMYDQVKYYFNIEWMRYNPLKSPVSSICLHKSWIVDNADEIIYPNNDMLKLHTCSEKNDWVLVPTDSLCSTYPSFVHVPRSSLDKNLKLLRECTNFRSENRFPVLSYLDNHSGIALCRAAQPLSGLTGKSVSDRTHLENIANGRRLLIADLRPKINAFANRAQGKGFESERDYDFVQYQFLGLENIHVVRDAWFDSFPHLKTPVDFEILNSDSDDKQYVFTTMVSLRRQAEFKGSIDIPESAGMLGVKMENWFYHIHKLLQASSQIATRITDPTHSTGNILIHCSDGWDRTSQVCALIQIMIDPMTRTIEGFRLLLQKEWLDFGFKFADRCGQVNFLNFETARKEFSPIWLQFLEAVYQLMNYYPTAFEFNEELLVDLQEIAGRFDYCDFRGNYSRERILFEQNGNFKHFWKDQVNSIMYKNELYLQNSPNICKIPSIQCFSIWARMYSRFQTAWVFSYACKNAAVQIVPALNSILCTAMNARCRRLRDIIAIDSRSNLLSTFMKSPANTNLGSHNFWLECGLNHLIVDLQQVGSFFICDRCQSLICSRCAQFHHLINGNVATSNFAKHALQMDSINKATYFVSCGLTFGCGKSN